MASTFYGVEVVIDEDYLRTMRDAFERIPDEFHARIESKVLPEIETLARGWMAEPGEPQYPLRWTPSKHPEDADKTPNTAWGYYSRQKAAFFASDGFGAGIPYVRTHELIDSWYAIQLWEGDELVIRLESPAKAAPFVMGNWQQGYHFDTGWQSIADIAQAASLDASDLLIQTWSFLMRDLAKGRVS